jgi:hypothetical protein
MSSNEKAVRKPACKPGSVPPVAVTAIYLACGLPSRSSSLPESHNGPDQPCSLIWPCSRWGLPSQPVTRLLVGSYIKGPESPHRFTLTGKACGFSGGMLSVALSRSLTTLPLSAAAVSDGGRYPPPRPVEPGLSSPRSIPRQLGANSGHTCGLSGQRPSGRLVDQPNYRRALGSLGWQH